MFAVQSGGLEAPVSLAEPSASLYGMRCGRHLFAAVLLAAGSCAAQAAGDGTAPGEGVQLHAVIERYCIDCHGANKQKGEVRFDKLADLSAAARVELLGVARELLELGEMPPEDAPQPSERELARLKKWLRSSVAAPDLADKMRYPHYGNLVDHDELFSGATEQRAFTPARRWLVSPQIFHERVMDVFKLTGRDRDGKQHRGFVGVTNPFLLNDHSGVRYYDLEALDGGDLLVMLGNAGWIADRQILMARILGGERKVEFPDKRDRWKPRQIARSYAAFTAILKAPGSPDDGELAAAVQEQFDCVLRREASESEQARYVDLLREFFQGLVNHAQITLHVDALRGRNAHHIAETVFKAFGRALRAAVELDPRSDVIPSTKGTL